MGSPTPLVFISRVIFIGDSLGIHTPLVFIIKSIFTIL